MSNSNLVDYRRIFKNHSVGRQGHAIDRVVIHHVAGICSVEDLGRFSTENGKPPQRMGLAAMVGLGNMWMKQIGLGRHPVPE